MDEDSDLRCGVCGRSLVEPVSETLQVVESRADTQPEQFKTKHKRRIFWVGLMLVLLGILTIAEGRLMLSQGAFEGLFLLLLGILALGLGAVFVLGGPFEPAESNTVWWGKGLRPPPHRP